MYVVYQLREKRRAPKKKKKKILGKIISMVLAHGIIWRGHTRVRYNQRRAGGLLVVRSRTIGMQELVAVPAHPFHRLPRVMPTARAHEGHTNPHVHKIPTAHAHKRTSREREESAQAHAQQALLRVSLRGQLGIHIID